MDRERSHCWSRARPKRKSMRLFFSDTRSVTASGWQNGLPAGSLVRCYHFTVQSDVLETQVECIANHETVLGIDFHILQRNVAKRTFPQAHKASSSRTITRFEVPDSNISKDGCGFFRRARSAKFIRQPGCREGLHVEVKHGTRTID